MANRMRKMFLGFAATLALALCGTLAACGEGGIGDIVGGGGGGEQQQPLTMVKQETMKFDGRVLTWEAVSGAEKYSITINGGAEYFSSVAQFSWPATNVDMVDVQIKAIRGEEVSAEVIDGPHSVIYDQAENRMHAQKAVLYYFLKELK